MSEPAPQQPVREKYVPPIPPIGWPVHWFEGANKNGNCWPAFVLKYGITGSIEVIAWQGGVPQRKKCNHVDDPRLKTMDATSRAMQGGWDFMPGMANDKNKKLPLDGSGSSEDLMRELALARHEMAALRKDLFGDPDSEDLEDRILKVARLHPDNARKIAEICACPVQKVNGVLGRARRNATEGATA